MTMNIRKGLIAHTKKFIRPLSTSCCGRLNHSSLKIILLNSGKSNLSMIKFPPSFYGNCRSLHLIGTLT